MDRLKEHRQFLDSLLQMHPEMHLLIDMVKTDHQNNEQISHIINKIKDWDYFISLSERHKLIPVVYKNSTPFSTIIPKEVIQILKNKTEENSKKTLAFTSEIITLTNLFKENLVPVIFFKGPLLSEFLYNNISERQSVDIDFLIHEKDIERTEKILLSSGFKRISPDFELNKTQFKWIKKQYNQFCYIHSQKKIVIELHWKIFKHNELFPVSTSILFSNVQTIKIANQNIPFLSGENLQLYLAVHGSHHRWYRLSWIRDFAFLLQHNKDIFDTVFIQSSTWKINTLYLQSLILTHLIFNNPLPDLYIKNNNELNYLIRESIKSLFLSDSELRSRKINRIKKILYNIQLKNSFFYKLKCFISISTNPNDWKILSLPSYLFWLYIPLRPFIWFYDVYLSKKNKNQH